MGLCSEACHEVWRDIWSQRCVAPCTPALSVLPHVCHGCGVSEPVWLHRCGSAPLCEGCNRRVLRGWPSVRHATRHSGHFTKAGWDAVCRDIRAVRIEELLPPDEPTVELPLLLWVAALVDSPVILARWRRP